MEKITREIEKLTREQVIEKLGKGEKNFSYLDLSGLALDSLDLSNLDLSHSNLEYANLEYANLSNANLHCADLIRADLSYAELENAILDNAYLAYADLSYTDLSEVNLENTNLEYSNLYNACLNEKEQIRKGTILKESMIVYKKCENGVIVTLEIPKGAIVFSINRYKCRTNKAKVIDISDEEKIAYSIYDDSFVYELGKEIEIEDFDLRYNVEWSTGIHFYRTREEAENY